MTRGVIFVAYSLLDRTMRRADEPDPKKESGYWLLETESEIMFQDEDENFTALTISGANRDIVIRTNTSKGYVPWASVSCFQLNMITDEFGRLEVLFKEGTPAHKRSQGHTFGLLTKKTWDSLVIWHGSQLCFRQRGGGQ